MYKYDEYDQQMVDTRVAEFRDQVRRRLAGDLTEDQFKPLRLQNGLYLQLHAYMLRVAVPYGTLNSAQMTLLGDIADKYDRGYGHFTTRQNIQYNWIKLEDTPDILAELAKVEMHAIQTSGNCIRNISSDQFAGAAADEIVDPRPYAELLRQWSSFHPEFLVLPRKFKIAVIASETDRAAMRLHDIGIKMVKNDAGEIGARFYAGGGMGRTPMIAPLIREFVPLDQLITYSEACLRVYNRYGRRDNKYKARIKILVHELGRDEYVRQVEEEFAHLLSQPIEPPLAELERIKAHFTGPAYEAGLSDDLDLTDPDFRLWVERNTHAHKQAGYVIATVSLKPVGGIPGDATADQIRLMAKLAKDYSFDELRVTHAQNIVFPHLRKADLYTVWQALDEAQDLRLHQRLRPPPRGPYRHPRRRQEGPGKLPAPVRRQRGRGHLAREDHRPRFHRGRRGRRHRKGHRSLSRQQAGRGALPRHLSPYRHGPVQGGHLWLTSSSASVTTKPSTTPPSR
jgi:sulfite reductase (NADPH) hemoprotein beta-component